MKLTDLALLIVLFVIVTFLLSLFNIISITLMDILSYSLLITGIALVYGETLRQNRLSVFIGSIIFLLGVYFLISENFTLNISEGISVPIILIFAGSGLLVMHISTSTRIIFLLISIILFFAGISLFIVNSNWHFESFFKAILLILNFLWPVAIIILVLVLLQRNK